MSAEERRRGFLSEAVDIALDKRTFIAGLILIWIFTLSMIFIVTSISYLSSTPQGQRILDELNREKAGIKGLNFNPLFLFIIIFARNSLVSALIFITSITIIIPLSIIAINGSVVGLVVYDFVEKLTTTGIPVQGFSSPITLSHSYSIILSYIMLAPHGMLEIASISLVGAAIAWLISPDKRLGILRSTVRAGSRLLALTVSNLLISAIVEAFVTFTLAILVMGILYGLSAQPMIP